MGRTAHENRDQLVSEYERSGLTQEQFAKQHGLAVSTLRSWIYRRRRASGERQLATAPRLLPVHVVASPAPQARADREPLEIVLANGATLRFASGTNATYIAELVSALA